MNPAVVWILIPIACILVAGIKAVAGMYFSHQERIAMIEQGMNPDGMNPDGKNPYAEDQIA